jgi:hypothetical protein
MTILSVLGLAVLLLIGFSLLTMASNQDDVDNHTDFH